MKYSFTRQELEDIWSALDVFSDTLTGEGEKQTLKDVRKTIAKVKKYLGYKNLK